jgi:hypothetical protein
VVLDLYRLVDVQTLILLVNVAIIKNESILEKYIHSMKLEALYGVENKIKKLLNREVPVRGMYQSMSM